MKGLEKMRMRRTRVQEFYHKKRIPMKDSESGSYDTYGSAAVIQGEIWPASGKVQAAMYGEKLSYVRNVKINGKYSISVDDKNRTHYIFESGLDITESDGLCIYVSKDSDPDYKIISIKPYLPLRLEAEKL